MILMYKSINYTLGICYWKKVAKIFFPLYPQKEGEKNNLILNRVFTRMIHLQCFGPCPNLSFRHLMVS